MEERYVSSRELWIALVKEFHASRAERIIGWYEKLSDLQEDRNILSNDTETRFVLLFVQPHHYSVRIDQSEI